jgi:integrase
MSGFWFATIRPTLHLSRATFLLNSVQKQLNHKSEKQVRNNRDKRHGTAAAVVIRWQ